MPENQKHLTIQELVPGRLYERIDNPYPNHILHFVDEDGCYWNKDLIVKTQHKNFVGYNEALSLRFVDVGKDTGRYPQ